jgi:hypothetical protein
MGRCPPGRLGLPGSQPAVRLCSSGALLGKLLEIGERLGITDAMKAHDEPARVSAPLALSLEERFLEER